MTNFKEWLTNATGMLEGYDLILRISKDGDTYNVVFTPKANNKSPELMPQVFKGTLDEVAAVLEGTGQGLAQAIAETGDRYANWKEAFAGATDAPAPASGTAAPAKRAYTKKADKEAAAPIQGIPTDKFNVLLSAVKQGISTLDEVKLNNPMLSVAQLQELSLSQPSKSVTPAPTELPPDNPVNDMDDLELEPAFTVNDEAAQLIKEVEILFAKGDSAAVRVKWPRLVEIRKSGEASDATLQAILALYQMISPKK